MQGSKKGTDGLSDSSSIGSVLDDADREVSSLTDRAFRSLCVSEDTSLSDSDLALSPDITRQVFQNFHQGTVSHTQRKSGIWSQLPSQGTEHAGWAATFQQLPKYVQGEEKYPKSSPPLTPVQRRLEVPISGLRSSSKPVSKVSSLIKSFDRTESQQGDGRPPASKNAPKFLPLPESGVNFCFDSAFLTVRRVPAEVSGTHQNSHQPARTHGERESPQSPDMACQGSSGFLPTSESMATSLESSFPSPPHRPAVTEPRRSQEPARRSTFLHSENSAFESWSARQPRLLERKDPAEAVPESRSPKLYEDAALLRESQAPERKASPCQLLASCGQEESRLTASALSTPGPWRPRDPEMQVFLMEEQASYSKPDLPAKPTQPPWRKPKTCRGKETVPDVSERKPASSRGPAAYTKHSPQGQFPENESLDDAMDPSACYDPPFNISKLLTPVIPTKHVLDPSDSPPREITPLPPGQLNGYQEKEPSEGPPRDSYKSKAPSLLFNLKDVRKRVKSTYSPSPLSKGLEEKSRDQPEPISNGVVLPNGLEENPPKEFSKERPADTPLLHISAQKDPKADPGATSSDDYPTLSSAPAIARAPFSVNGESTNRNSREKDATNEDSGLGAARYSWSPDPRAHGPRKHLSLKLCGREPDGGRAAGQLRTLSLENGFSRSISQETEPGKEAGLQNPQGSQKFSPGPLSPEEEDVFYSDSQSDFTPGLKSKAKFSTSSSDQSFASFEDQQKMWVAQSQEGDGKNDVRTGDSQKDETGTVTGKDEHQYCAFGNGHVCAEEQSTTGMLQGEGGCVSGGRPRKASREEANFRGTKIGGSKDVALSQAKDLTPSPSATSNKHRLFVIKDNTLRATPVIKPIMLPLLRTLSSDDPLSSGHKEEELPRPGWGEDTGLCAPRSQDMPSTPTPTGMRGPLLKAMAHKGMEDPGGVASVARMETRGSVSSIPLIGEGEGWKPPQDATQKVVVPDSQDSTAQRKLEAPRGIPMIALPKSDAQVQPPSQQLGTSWEEQTQDFRSHFLCTPRTGPPGRRLAPGETATSPNTSSLEESSVYSPAASELGLPPGEPPRASPWASLSPARVARREDLTHGFTWEASSDPLLESSTEDRRTLSPRGSLLDMATSSVVFPENTQPSAHLERASAKPPAVPPKTEKALRRAKKLASKRRKMDQTQEVHGRPQEEKPPPGDPEPRPMSPRDRLLPRLPAVRTLPPPMHRHSVSTFSEPVSRRPGEPQPLTPLFPYPTTQKILQDPQSGEYFVFNLPLQVKTKTFYDPETGKYVKVSVPFSEGCPETPAPDELTAPYMLLPGVRALPTTALVPLRCSSQLSAPTFLREGPGATEAARPRPQSTYAADLQPAPGPHGEPTRHPAGPGSSEPPRIPGQERVDTPSLGIISTDDLEDFAMEGIS